MGIGKIMGTVMRGAGKVLKSSVMPMWSKQVGFKGEMLRLGMVAAGVGYSSYTLYDADKNGLTHKEADKILAGLATAIGGFICPAASIIGGAACYFGNPAKKIEQVVNYFLSSSKSEDTEAEEPEETTEAEQTEEQPLETIAPADSTTVTNSTVPIDSTVVTRADSTTIAGNTAVADSTTVKETTKTGATGDAVAAQAATEETNPDLIYTVKKGDCVWNIAKAQLIKKNSNAAPTNAQILELTLKLVEHNKLRFEADNYHVKIFPDDKLKMLA